MRIKKSIPDNEQVRLIFKDTYNLYQKYKNARDSDDWEALNQEARELNKKYPHQLCNDILVSVLEIIERRNV